MISEIGIVLFKYSSIVIGSLLFLGILASSNLFKEDAVKSFYDTYGDILMGVFLP